jgi:hypothetical protein
MKKSAKTIVWSVILIILAYFLVRYIIIGPKSVPEVFGASRAGGAKLALEIAALSEESVEKLAEISRKDRDFDFIGAKIIIAQEILRNKELKNKALALSNQLAKMAQNLSGIQPRRGRELAAEAIGYEVAMVSRLIAYNGKAEEIFELLKAKYEGGEFYPNSEVNKYIDELNATARTVNTFNKAFEETLKKFDEVYK